METITGKVSMLQPVRRVGRHGVAWHKTAFLLGDRPVDLTVSEAPQIEEGDELVVAGDIQEGADRTLVVVGSMMILMGVLTLFILVGFLVIPLGIYLVNKGRKAQRGMLNGYAFHNRTRHVYGAGHVTLEYVIGAFLVVLGVCTIPILVGLVITPVGVHGLVRGRRTAQARAAVGPMLPGSVTSLPAAG